GGTKVHVKNTRPISPFSALIRPGHSQRARLNTLKPLRNHNGTTPRDFRVSPRSLPLQPAQSATALKYCRYLCRPPRLPLRQSAQIPTGQWHFPVPTVRPAIMLIHPPYFSGVLL